MSDERGENLPGVHAEERRRLIEIEVARARARRTCGYCRRPGHKRPNCPELTAHDESAHPRDQSDPRDPNDPIGEAAQLRQRIDALTISIDQHEAARSQIERLLIDERVQLELATRRLAEIRSARAALANLPEGS